ncbi:phosphopantetheine-binding protein [Guyparkeria halopsychrophila]|uniref:phosphopantetheine-binding protein n=1 Tax=Guyparkeria halopsychrophila TaxID=3139421 RepID=UPI0037CB25E6
MTESHDNSIDALIPEVAAELVEALNLDETPEEIDPDEPLFGDGLGLDSIDVLEIALVVSRRYGLNLRSDDDRNEQIFASLRDLCRFIAENRTK